MHETLEERARRLLDYVRHFQTACLVRGATLPSQEDAEAYFDDAIDCDLAVGHYLVDRHRRNRPVYNES